MDENSDVFFDFFSEKMKRTHERNHDEQAMSLESQSIQRPTDNRRT